MTSTRIRALTAATVVFALVVAVLAILLTRNDEQPAESSSNRSTPAATAATSPDASVAPDTRGPDTPVSSDDTPAPTAAATPTPDDGIDSFQECADAGYPIAESYPRQCFANGRGFTEPTPAP